MVTRDGHLITLEGHAKPSFDLAFIRLHGEKGIRTNLIRMGYDAAAVETLTAAVLEAAR